jgi:hypothetical protein
MLLTLSSLRSNFRIQLFFNGLVHHSDPLW